MYKRLLVLSDTHGSVSSLTAVFAWAKGFAPSTAVFLGDGISDLQKAMTKAGFFCILEKVRGNNDVGAPCMDTSVFDFGGHRFFLCHGHRHDLYRGTDMLVSEARDKGASVALFGHTHIPFQEDSSGVLLVNPGSVGNPRSHVGATFASIECATGKPLKLEFWGVDFGGNVSPVSVGNSYW